MKLYELKEKIDSLVDEGKGDLHVLVSEEARKMILSDLTSIEVHPCYKNGITNSEDIGVEYDEEDISQKIVIMPW